jgi:hypothetical protein
LVEDGIQMRRRYVLEEFEEISNMYANIYVQGKKSGDHLMDLISGQGKGPTKPTVAPKGPIKQPPKIEGGKQKGDV